ncbi:MAG: YfiR family protein [Vicinamibacterales bacterium]
MSHCRRAFRLLVAFAITALTTVSAAEVVPEARLKAAFVSKFPQFVDWPGAALDSRSSLDVCVGDPDPFGADLSALLRGESVRGRPLRVRTVTASDPIANCHLLFVPAGPAQRSLLSAAANHPILTVGDDPAFLDDGGMIALRVVNGRVRFEIDDAAARRVGLRISSQLLGLAVAVRGGGTR